MASILMILYSKMYRTFRAFRREVSLSFSYFLLHAHSALPNSVLMPCDSCTNGMTVKKISKNMVAEVYLEDVMQALTATGNVCMQHLRARTNARTSFILCLPVGIIAFKHNSPRPIILVMFGGICVSVSVSVLSAPGCVCKNAGEKVPRRVHLKLSVRPKPDVLPSDVR